MDEPLTFSVIVPVLNEAGQIVDCIAAIRNIDPAVEIIVADGGSRDATVERAAAAGVLVCRAPRGRGPQCHAGATRASGDILLFLHADTQLPADAFGRLRRLFGNQHVQIAKFRLWFDSRDWLLDLAARCMWVDTFMTSYGDQCVVLRRSFYHRIGGFPGWPLFEDVRLFEKARRRSRVRVVPARVITSARRFRKHGAIRQLLHDFWLLGRYMVGASPRQIAASYERGGAALREREIQKLSDFN
jgi:rSAM/selenodomain-associated transferase 2